MVNLLASSWRVELTLDVGVIGARSSNRVNVTAYVDGAGLIGGAAAAAEALARESVIAHFARLGGDVEVREVRVGFAKAERSMVIMPAEARMPDGNAIAVCEALTLIDEALRDAAAGVPPAVRVQCLLDFAAQTHLGRRVRELIVQLGNREERPAVQTSARVPEDAEAIEWLEGAASGMRFVGAIDDQARHARRLLELIGAEASR